MRHECVARPGPEREASISDDIESGVAKAGFYERACDDETTVRFSRYTCSSDEPRFDLEFAQECFAQLPPWTLQTTPDQTFQRFSGQPRLCSNPHRRTSRCLHPSYETELTKEIQGHLCLERYPCGSFSTYRNAPDNSALEFGDRPELAGHICGK